MNRCFSLSTHNFPEVILRTISMSDLENLRTWKNEHRRAFFFHGVISREDQIKWFHGYLERPNDYMFVIAVGDRPIGCLGFRYIDGKVDVYNVIRGVLNGGTKGAMTKAMQMLCSYAWERYSSVIGAQVLCNNPAIHWYYLNGFKTVQIHEEYSDVELDLDVFIPSPIEVVEMDKQIYEQKGRMP